VRAALKPGLELVHLVDPKQGDDEVLATAALAFRAQVGHEQCCG
jgi:hypothetical protein